MKLTKKLCHSVGIINDYDYSNRGIHPVLSYHRAQNGRISEYAYWGIWMKGKSFSNFWRDYGIMKFHVYRREEKQKQFEMALDWIYKNFGITEIVRTPLGSYMEKSFVEKRNKEIENAIRQGISLRDK